MSQGEQLAALQPAGIKRKSGAQVSQPSRAAPAQHAQRRAQHASAPGRPATAAARSSATRGMVGEVTRATSCSQSLSLNSSLPAGAGAAGGEEGALGACSAIKGAQRPSAPSAPWHRAALLRQSTAAPGLRSASPVTSSYSRQPRLHTSEAGPAPCRRRLSYARCSLLWLAPPTCGGRGRSRGGDTITSNTLAAGMKAGAARAGSGIHPGALGAPPSAPAAFRAT